MQGEGARENLRGRRIMVVEDEGLILMMLTDLLQELGCEVAAAERRTDRAVAAARAAAIDAALLDVNLGDGQTSYAIADVLAARGIPFAFLTGYGRSVADLNPALTVHLVCFTLTAAASVGSWRRPWPLKLLMERQTVRYLTRWCHTIIREGEFRLGD